MTDTHIHIWNFEKARYSWLENTTSILNRNYLIEELESERLAMGITGGILVQAANTTEETDYLLEIAAATPWIKGVTGWLPLTDTGKTEKLLKEKYLHNPYFKAVRHLVHDEPDTGWLLQDNVVNSLAVLAKHKVPYEIVGVLNAHISTAIELAQKLPAAKMVFDHMNQPPILEKERFGQWGILMREAARQPNLFVKISGLGTASGKGERWNADDIRPYIEFVLEHFGEERCFAGGDWPVSLLAGSYTKTWNIYTAILSQLPDSNIKRKVFDTNAAAFYNTEH